MFCCNRLPYSGISVLIRKSASPMLLYPFCEFSHDCSSVWMCWTLCNTIYTCSLFENGHFWGVFCESCFHDIPKLRASQTSVHKLGKQIALLLYLYQPSKGLCRPCELRGCGCASCKRIWTWCNTVGTCDLLLLGFWDIWTPALCDYHLCDTSGYSPRWTFSHNVHVDTQISNQNLEFDKYLTRNAINISIYLVFGFIWFGLVWLGSIFYVLKWQTWPN